MPIIALDDPPTTRPGGTTRIFEGERHGFVPMSMFLTDVAAGKGVSAHFHPYAEVFVVQEGLARFTMDSETTDVAEGHIVIVPAGVIHEFVNLGPGRLRQISIHPSPKVIQTWLDEDEAPQLAPVTAQATQAH